MVKKLFPLILLSFHAEASTLPYKDIIINNELSYTNSTQMWTGESRKRKFNNGNGSARLTTWGFSTSVQFGLPQSFELKLWMNYNRTKLKNAPYLDARAGSNSNKIDEVGISFKRHLWNSFNNFYDIDMSVGYTHPIKTSPKLPAVVSSHDFSHGFTVQFDQTLNFSWSQLSLTAAHIFRIGPPSDQFKAELLYSMAISRQWRLGPGVNWLHTYDGVDILSPAFFGPSRQFLELKRERFAGVSFFIERDINHQWWMGVAANAKIWGHNSNVGQTYTTYASYYF